MQYAAYRDSNRHRSESSEDQTCTVEFSCSSSLQPAPRHRPPLPTASPTLSWSSGLCQGYTNTAQEGVGVEEVRDNIEQIRNTNGFVVPGSAAEEMMEAMKSLMG